MPSRPVFFEIHFNIIPQSTPKSPKLSQFFYIYNINYVLSYIVTPSEDIRQIIYMEYITSDTTKFKLTKLTVFGISVFQTRILIFPTCMYFFFQLLYFKVLEWTFG